MTTPAQEPRDADRITDAQGRAIERLAVKQAQGQLVWDTRTMSPGLYHVELVADGKRMHAEKLIVKP